MDNSHRFFENRDCPYFPCHTAPDGSALPHFNCLFCYCPFYFLDRCPGTPQYRPAEGGVIKDCTNCCYPHLPEHYDEILSELRKDLVRPDPGKGEHP